jgi:galactose mutarotase-like enzyme
MNVVGTNCAVRHEQGFEVFILSNEEVELAVVPELGARIISLRDLRTGREWLWHPAGGRKLFRNCSGDNFETGPLVGLDECLPTIAPCSWKERDLPDHGEVWAAAWALDSEAWERGRLRTRVSLKISPFDFERTIELEGNIVRLSYQLTNRCATEELYLWAMHPLLRLQSGDQLELPDSTRALLDGASWLDALSSARPKRDCEKIFACRITEGRAAINNPATGDRLGFEWDAAENNTLGLWFNRGGWHGHHHFALEPANGAPDVLTDAARQCCCGAVAPHSSVTWQICIKIGN